MARRQADRVLSPAATEPVVSAHSGDAPSRLKWHITDNLRWLADNPAATRLPCGLLHGSFLIQVADAYDNLVAEVRRLEGRE